jgi:hypothetical protein
MLLIMGKLVRMTTNRRTFIASLFAAPVAAAVSFTPRPKPGKFVVMIRCDTTAFMTEMEYCMAMIESTGYGAEVESAFQKLSKTPIILTMDGREIEPIFVDVTDLAPSAHAAQS